MSDPKVHSEGNGGVQEVRIDGVHLDDVTAQQVLRVQELYYLDRIPKGDYFKFLRRLKARAESSEVE